MPMLGVYKAVNIVRFAHWDAGFAAARYGWRCNK